MTSTQKTYTSLLKTISPVLSNSNFNRIIKEDDVKFVKNRASKYLNFNEDLELFTYNDFFEHLYNSMLKNYRNEFVYKNEIVNKILLGRHSLNTATILNEFRIGKSIADLIMLNGTSVVYEIKTEYDSTERLLNQIKEYRKSFLKVVIVTHMNVLEKYKSFLLKHELSNIGLLALTNRNTLKPIYEPIADDSHLEISYMFKCLRKKEYTNLIYKYFGFIPDVPNTKLFRECLNLAKKIDKLVFHDFMFSYLKKRTVKEKKVVSSLRIPTYLKHISICSNFEQREIEKLNSFLNKNL